MSQIDPVNVLIVDDDRAIQRFLADALTKKGFVVTVERDGEWAVKTFEKKEFDVVLLDLLLPALSGYEVAQRIQASGRGHRIPVIFMSGVYTTAVHQQEAVEKHGAFAFLEKPFTLGTLFDTLQSALGERFPESSAPPPPPQEADENTPVDQYADKAAHDEQSAVEQLSNDTAPRTALTGELSDRPFPEVLAEIYRARGSGALLLRRDKVKKVVYFRDGFPQSVKSNLLSECLGKLMVRERMISEAECEESILRMKSSGRQQGTVLIEMGCISPHNLVYALKQQLQTKLFDIFRWEHGSFDLNPRIDPPADPIHLEMTAAAIIYEGVRRYYDSARLKRVMGDMSALYVHPSEDPLYALQDAGLGEEELALLKAADGHKTVATLRAMDLMPPLDTDRLIYAMHCAQMISLREEAVPGKPRPSIAMMAQVAPPKPPPLPSPSKPELPAAPPLELPPLSQSLPTGEAKALTPESAHFEQPQAVGSLLPELSGLHNLSGEEKILRERLIAKVNSLQKMDYFDVLGVTRAADREEIKRAYFGLAKEFHPDKHFGSASPELRNLARQVYELISRAHDTLSDASRKDAYVRQLAGGAQHEAGDEVARMLTAEGKFQKGEELLRQRDLKGALEHFREALSFYNEEGEFHAFYGFTLFQTQPHDSATVDSALESLEKAISLNPKLDKGYLFTGYIYKALGRPDKAEKQFEKAIQANPDCTDALRELRILGKGKR